jgi:ethanolamine permease
MGAARPDGTAQLRGGQLRVRDIWALGVGIVVCGQYFGWNLGLKDNGPVAMLIASLAVCLLFLAWVLTLAELAVAMPRAGGPLDYGLRAGGPWVGFLMGWSMFLECLFGGVATALAGGKYVAFLLSPAGGPNKYVAVAVGLTIVLVFFLLQARGVKEQARALVWMTYAAVGGLVVFWVAASTNFAWDRVWASPAIPAGKGWGAVLDAIPFALWWLIIIEAAALAAEESHAPARTIPRGLTWAILTVIVLVVLTTVTACGALPFQQIAAKDGKPVDYPLAEVIRQIPAGRSPLLFYGFGALALFGLVASYHGLLYGSSRQLYALGRGGLVWPALGRVNARRQTPVPALAVCSLLTAAFVVANLWFDKAIQAAVLIAGLAALALYILSMGALFWLRRREPELLKGYRAPLGAWLPLCVVVLSVVALAVYPRIDERGVVVPVAVGMYAIGIGYFALRGRNRMTHRPEGLTPADAPSAPVARRPRWLHLAAVVALVVSLGVIGAVTVASFGGPDLFGSPGDVPAAAVLGVIVAALAAVAGVELWQTSRGGR